MKIRTPQDAQDFGLYEGEVLASHRRFANRLL